MIPLFSFLDLLPRYDRNNAHGKKGDVTKAILFVYENSTRSYSYSDLTPELIMNTVVISIYPTSTAYRGHSSGYIIVACRDIREEDDK